MNQQTASNSSHMKITSSHLQFGRCRCCRHLPSSKNFWTLKQGGNLNRKVILQKESHFSEWPTYSLKKTGRPENRPTRKRKRESIPTIHFQVRTVSFREGTLNCKGVTCSLHTLRVVYYSSPSGHSAFSEVICAVFLRVHMHKNRKISTGMSMVLCKWIFTPIWVGRLSPVSRWNKPTY